MRILRRRPLVVGQPLLTYWTICASVVEGRSTTEALVNRARRAPRICWHRRRVTASEASSVAGEGRSTAERIEQVGAVLRAAHSTVSRRCRWALRRRRRLRGWRRRRARRSIAIMVSLLGASASADAAHCSCRAPRRECTTRSAKTWLRDAIQGRKYARDRVLQAGFSDASHGGLPVEQGFPSTNELATCAIQSVSVRQCVRRECTYERARLPCTTLVRRCMYSLGSEEQVRLGRPRVPPRVLVCATSLDDAPGCDARVSDRREAARDSTSSSQQR